jgi:ubiquitin C-terminal hydrolase
VFVYRSEVLYESKKQSSCTFQSFHCLSVDIGHTVASNSSSSESVSLEQCLDALFAVERLYRGRDLGPSTTATSSSKPTSAAATMKSTLLDTLPTVLVLHLKRFSFSLTTGEAYKASFLDFVCYISSYDICKTVGSQRRRVPANSGDAESVAVVGSYRTAPV